MQDPYIQTSVSLASQEVLDAYIYLQSTDWMVIREMDSGVKCPQDVKDKRVAARLIINPLPPSS